MKNILIVTRSKSIAAIVSGFLEDADYQGRVTVAHKSPHFKERLAMGQYDIILIESCFYHCVTANILARFIRKYKNLRLVVFAMEECSPRTAARFIYWGVESYLNFRDSPEKYRIGLSQLLKGKQYLPEYVEVITERYDELPEASLELTPRENEIVRLIAAGKSTDEIARTLDLKQKTVENHKASMYEKCNVRNSIELLRFAIHRGILDVEDLCS